MRSVLPGGLAAFAALSVFAADVSAKIAPPPPASVRTARSSAAVVGKVVRIEDKPVTMPDGAEMRVAVVQVAAPLMGLKDVTHVRVAFHPGENRRFPHLNLKVGQEALFFLYAAPGKEVLFTVPAYWDVAPLDTVAGEMEEIKRCAKLLDNPMSGLKSAVAQERLLTAALLLTRYRTGTYGAGKQAPIDAAESKLLLEILAGADWNAPLPLMPYTKPQMLFLQLGLEAKDGWQTPADLSRIEPEAKKWLQANAGTYRIKRFVPEP
jgi:hypothetical protein